MNSKIKKIIKEYFTLPPVFIIIIFIPLGILIAKYAFYPEPILCTKKIPLIDNIYITCKIENIDVDFYQK